MKTTTLFILALGFIAGKTANAHCFNEVAKVAEERMQKDAANYSPLPAYTKIFSVQGGGWSNGKFYSRLKGHDADSYVVTGSIKVYGGQSRIETRDQLIVYMKEGTCETLTIARHEMPVPICYGECETKKAMPSFHNRAKFESAFKKDIAYADIDPSRDPKETHDESESDSAE